MKFIESETLPRKHNLFGAARQLLQAFDKFDAPGLERTPERFASVFLDPKLEEDPKETLKQGLVVSEAFTGMVVENGLSFYSLCEHHLLPFFGSATIAYIPSQWTVCKKCQGRQAQINLPLGAFNCPDLDCGGEFYEGPRALLAGLSKLPRVLNSIANGPNLQERITNQVTNVIEEVLQPKAVGVILSATHLCMAMRGVKLEDSRTTTSELRGMFLEPGSSARAEFLNLRRRE